MMKVGFVLVACGLLLVGCARRSDGPEPKFDKMVSIKVTKAGEVFYNKKPVSVDELARELNQLPKASTGVCYYREDPGSEPPPVAKQVLQKIIDARLAVKLSEEECP
jgi:hypothetical protein